MEEGRGWVGMKRKTPTAAGAEEGESGGVESGLEPVRCLACGARNQRRFICCIRCERWFVPGSTVGERDLTPEERKRLDKLDARVKGLIESMEFFTHRRQELLEKAGGYIPPAVRHHRWPSP